MSRGEGEDMVELERDESQDIEVWSDADFSHVIVQETESTYRYGSPGPGFYVRDENRELGPYAELAHAFTAAELVWGDVTLAPANRLRRDIENGDENDAGTFLLEYLARYGTAGIDAQALASQVFARIEES